GICTTSAIRYDSSESKNPKGRRYRTHVRRGRGSAPGARNKGPTCKHLFYCAVEICTHKHFRYVRIAARCETRRHLVGILRHTDEDDFRFATLNLQPFCHTDPIQNGQGNV